MWRVSLWFLSPFLPIYHNYNFQFSTFSSGVSSSANLRNSHSLASKYVWVITTHHHTPVTYTQTRTLVLLLRLEPAHSNTQLQIIPRIMLPTMFGSMSKASWINLYRWFTSLSMPIMMESLPYTLSLSVLSWVDWPKLVTRNTLTALLRPVCTVYIDVAAQFYLCHTPLPSLWSTLIIWILDKPTFDLWIRHWMRLYVHASSTPN